MDRIRAPMNKKPIGLIRWVSPLDRGLRGHSLDARFWISGQPQSWFQRMQPSATLARCVTSLPILAEVQWGTCQQGGTFSNRCRQPDHAMSAREESDLPAPLPFRAAYLAHSVSNNWDGSRAISSATPARQCRITGMTPYSPHVASTSQPLVVC